ncbi:hypothetical protein IFT64_17575 [Oxalobacteraceae sp. CFBP 8753]|nr:hypothetical protein [Oxalobacteraceae sp. CFBP 8753]
MDRNVGQCRPGGRAWHRIRRQGHDRPAGGTSGRIDVGGTYTHTSGVVSRSSASIVDADSMKRQLDLYTLWKRDARSRLRLSVSDLLQQDVRERRTFEGNAPLIRATTYRVRATWRLVWEHSL